MSSGQQLWRLHATLLPDGDRPVDWWVGDGRVWDSTPPSTNVAGLLPGRFALAGLVDAHAHVALDFRELGLSQGELVRANLRAHAYAGTTLLRDVGAPYGLRVHEHRRSDHPHVEAAGRFLAPPDGYMPWLYEPVGEHELVEAALAEVAAGSTWVKVVFDFFGRDPIAPPASFDPATLEAVVDAVHAAGARVAAHTTGPAVGEAVRAGVDSIEHGPYLTEELLEEMADRGAAWTPTLCTSHGIVSNFGPPGAELLAHLDSMVPVAARLGVTILAGTDDHGPGALPAEVARLVRCGLEPRAALAAASTVGRAFLGHPPFEPGSRADIVTYEHDPRDDPEVLAAPAAVVIGGHRVR